MSTFKIWNRFTNPTERNLKLNQWLFGVRDLQKVYNRIVSEPGIQWQTNRLQKQK